MKAVSKIDPNITEDYLLNSKESLYFERKGRDTKRTKIANEIVGMLNADGGVLAVGIEDNGIIDEGKTFISDIDGYRKLCKEMIQPTPNIKFEDIKINNNTIYLYHVSENNENVFSRKGSNEVYKRIGDSNYGPLNISEIDNLRYDKNLRCFEDQIVEDFDTEDFDLQLINAMIRIFAVSKTRLWKILILKILISS